VTNLVEIKWTQYGEIDPKREYMAFAQMGELKSSWSLISWGRRGKKVQEQLKTAKGFIGYTMQFGFWNKRGLIAAVFEDEKTLNEFPHTGQHAICFEKSKDDIKGEMKKARWSISGSALPLKIEEAIDRVQKQNMA